MGGGTYRRDLPGWFSLGCDQMPLPRSKVEPREASELQEVERGGLRRASSCSFLQSQPAGRDAGTIAPLLLGHQGLGFDSKPAF